MGWPVKVRPQELQQDAEAGRNYRVFLDFNGYADELRDAQVEEVVVRGIAVEEKTRTPADSAKVRRHDELVLVVHRPLGVELDRVMCPG